MPPLWYTSFFNWVYCYSSYAIPMIFLFLGKKSILSQKPTSFIYSFHLPTLRSVCHDFPLLNIKYTFPTTFTPRISHFRGNSSSFLHKVYLFPPLPSRKMPGKWGKTVLRTKRQNTEKEMGVRGVRALSAAVPAAQKVLRTHQYIHVYSLKAL